MPPYAVVEPPFQISVWSIKEVTQPSRRTNRGDSFPPIFLYLDFAASNSKSCYTASVEALESKLKLRPRISLLSLLLITAAVAFALTNARVSRENKALRSELTGYRAELGVLDDSCTECFNVIRIETEETPTHREWKWRLQAPAGSNLFLTISDGPVPLMGPHTGYSIHGLSIPLVPEMEHVFHVVATRNEATGTWHAELGWRREDGRVHKRVWEARFDWGNSDRIDVLEGVNYKTKQLPIDRPSVLARVRQGDVAVDPAPGFILWIEPQ